MNLNWISAKCILQLCSECSQDAAGVSGKLSLTTLPFILRADFICGMLATSKFTIIQISFHLPFSHLQT